MALSLIAVPDPKTGNIPCTCGAVFNRLKQIENPHRVHCYSMLRCKAPVPGRASTDRCLMWSGHDGEHRNK